MGRYLYAQEFSRDNCEQDQQASMSAAMEPLLEALRIWVALADKISTGGVCPHPWFLHVHSRVNCVPRS